MSWWSNITGGRDDPRPTPRARRGAEPGASVYEQRDVERGRTVIVEDGRIVGTLDERGDLVPLDQPPANRPNSWPDEWWTPIGEIEHWR